MSSLFLSGNNVLELDRKSAFYLLILHLFQYHIDMKTLIYFQDADTIKTSGIGRAMSHQLEALKDVGVETTTNKKDNYDIAHINTYWSKSHRTLRLAKKRGIPVIVHGHSTYEDFRNSFRCWKLVAPIYNRQLKYMYSRADLVIAPTPYARDLILSYGYVKKAIDISNGINIKEYVRNEEWIKKFHEKFNLKDDEPFIMGVGFPFERKGLIDFFEVAKSFPNIKFIWFGHLAKLLTNSKILKAIKHKPNNVIMPGYCKGELIKGAYQSATCLFFPSYEETEGIVVLEALASHCPLVVRNIGVYSPWLNEENAHLCNNNKEFINTISSLLEKGEDKAILEKGYQLALQRDLIKIGEKLKETYCSLLKKN